MVAKVVDASLLCAVLFGEPREEEAAQRLEGATLYAPSLLPYELSSVARKKMQLYPHLREELAQALETGLGLDIEIVEVDHSEALSLALHTGLTTYDASYLYLSRAQRIPLETFDEQLDRAAQP